MKRILLLLVSVLLAERIHGLLGSRGRSVRSVGNRLGAVKRSYAKKMKDKEDQKTGTRKGSKRGSGRGRKSARSSAVSDVDTHDGIRAVTPEPVSYTHLRAHETDSYLVCRLLLEKKKNK